MNSVEIDPMSMITACGELTNNVAVDFRIRLNVNVRSGDVWLKVEKVIERMVRIAGEMMMTTNRILDRLRPNVFGFLSMKNSHSN